MDLVEVVEVVVVLEVVVLVDVVVVVVVLVDLSVEVLLIKVKSFFRVSAVLLLVRDISCLYSFKLKSYGILVTLLTYSNTSETFFYLLRFEFKDTNL